MDDGKQKRQHTLPDRRLAKAFRFSASDLAANRNGFMTRAQSWAIPLGMRGVFAVTTSWITSKQQAAVDSICGRAKISYEQQQIQSLFHADFVEVYKLSINHFEFRITSRQYHALGEGVPYRLYYNSETKRILSLERATNGC